MRCVSGAYQGQSIALALMPNIKDIFKSMDCAGGPGGTRTPNQAVMSGRTLPNYIVFYIVYQSLLALNSIFVPLFQGQTGANL